MNRIAAPIAALLVILHVPANAAPSRWRPLETIPGHAPVSVLVQGKPRIYFRLDPTSDFAVDLKGPGRLKVVSRAEVEPGTVGAVSYRISLLEGNAAVKQHATESSITPKATLRGGHSSLCKSRTFTWPIPEGAHRVHFATQGKTSVLVRLLVSEPSAGTSMISMTPFNAPRSVTVSEGEKLIPYYSILPGKPVRLRVVGPTRLELLSRLDFDSTMRGPQAYRLAIVEQGQRPHEFQFTTTKAATAFYTDLRDRVASKVNRVVIPVGEGTHELSVELREPKDGSVEIHARIPEPMSGEAE